MTRDGGLRDVEVVDSSITAINADGLFYRGVPIGVLATQATFEEVAFLLWHDRRPNAAELATFRAAYAAAWEVPNNIRAVLDTLPADASPLLALQAALPLLESASDDAQGDASIRLLAQIPAILAFRGGADRSLLRADSALAEQVLRRLGARTLSSHSADATLILYADHELAASTFAARITAAAGASLADGLSAALAVLKGPLHGGAMRAVTQMLQHLGAAEDVLAAIDALLAQSQRIPGFGHSVYRGGDPRAAIFRTLALEIATDETGRWLRIADILADRMERERGLYGNVDLYGVVFLHAAGITDEMMLGIFAIARTAGWLAHMLEQRGNNRLIRPRAHYSGRLDRRWDEAAS